MRLRQSRPEPLAAPSRLREGDPFRTTPAPRPRPARGRTGIPRRAVELSNRPRSVRAPVPRPPSPSP
ncbi:hypothetical protein C5E05_18535 [Pseudoclavibacter sp. AY1H1]|nr:hypothetical protein C5E05_18535 [Pseudoclavibacter sp. AY1H1]